MSLQTPIEKTESKVHNSQYIRTENEDKPKESDTKPSETSNPAPTETK